MGIACKQCGAQVEAERECYATPVCFACLPPPKPLPKTYTQQHVDELTRERDDARANGAASERAAIVAMLHNEAFHLSAQADVTDDGYDANTMDDQARALRAAAERITRLDHHRDGGG